MARTHSKPAPLFDAISVHSKVNLELSRDIDTEPQKRRRLTPEEREEAIVAAAVSFFTEHGFEGQTRELARSMGITQPLLYRYFPNKDALIERVYQDVFVDRWNPDWESIIVDRRRGIEDRLKAFYRSYSQVILTPEWVRLFMFAGLKGLDFNGRYLGLLRSRIFEQIVTELRAAFGHPTAQDIPATDMEIEAIWALHASIFYLGVRQFIYHLPLNQGVDEIIDGLVQTLLGGVVAILPGQADHERVGITEQS